MSGVRVNITAVAGVFACACVLAGGWLGYVAHGVEAAKHSSAPRHSEAVHDRSARETCEQVTRELAPDAVAQDIHCVLTDTTDFSAECVCVRTADLHSESGPVPWWHVAILVTAYGFSFDEAVPTAAEQTR
jgi:hypothetical protein